MLIPSTRAFVTTNLVFVDESMGAFAVNAQKDLLQRLSSWLVPFCSRLRFM